MRVAKVGLVLASVAVVVSTAARADVSTRRPKSRLLTAAEIAESAKVAGLDPDNVDAKQSFDTDAFGPDTRVLIAPDPNPGSGQLSSAAVFVIRDGKLLEKHGSGCVSYACGDTVKAVSFEDLNKDGRADIVLIVSYTGEGGVGEDGKRVSIDDDSGFVLLQKADNSFAPQPLIGMDRSRPCVDKALGKSKGLTLKLLRAAYACAPGK